MTLKTFANIGSYQGLGVIGVLNLFCIESAVLQLLLLVLLYLGCPLRVRPAPEFFLEIKSKVHESERDICCHLRV